MHQEQTQLPGKTEEAKALQGAFRACPAVFLTTTRAIIIDATAEAGEFLNVHVGFLVNKPLLHFVARGDTRRFRTFVNLGVWEPIRVQLRPRHGRPRAVTLAIHQAEASLLWLVIPDEAESLVRVPPLAGDSA